MSSWEEDICFSRTELCCCLNLSSKFPLVRPTFSFGTFIFNLILRCLMNPIANIFSNSARSILFLSEELNTAECNFLFKIFDVTCDCAIAYVLSVFPYITYHILRNSCDIAIYGRFYNINQTASVSAKSVFWDCTWICLIPATCYSLSSDEKYISKPAQIFHKKTWWLLCQLGCTKLLFKINSEKFCTEKESNFR